MRQNSRFITVDSVLQYASDIPSMQARGPSARPRPARTGSGKPSDPKLAGRMISQPIPARSTKVSEKLVLLPEAETDGDLAEKEDFEDDNDAAPTRDDEELLRRTKGRTGKTYAERLPKIRRAEKLARVTAYCTAQAYKLKNSAVFLKDQHAARTKLYDDCLYTVYHLPLLSGGEGYRIQSSPVRRGPGGKVVLDEEIARSEGRDYGEGFFDGDGVVEERFEVLGNEQHDNELQASHEGESPHRDDVNGGETEHSHRITEQERRDAQSQLERPPSPTLSNALDFAEMFVFSYGVVVFWNFTERQEKDVMADLTFSESETGIPLSTRPQDEEDFETEEFHFEYLQDTPRPRLFNDMITLRSGDHMIKLAMSHAIAQSTKLSFFEQRMANQMIEAQHVPKRLALTGKLGLKREEVVKILGALFKSRVDVNLCKILTLHDLSLQEYRSYIMVASNMLDVPNFFWDSEPTLHPLYFAVREYLEIKPRIQVLNERCRVFLDLAEILSDSIADNKMSRLTWIIIILIVMSIFVTCFEVFLRFGILTKERSDPKPHASHQTCLMPSIGESGLF